MGQAQLLLIVLGTVVVGLAVMAGINAYEQNNIKSDLDAVTHECMRLASDAQTAAQKPEAFGGLWDTGDTTGEVATGYDFADQANAAGTEVTTTLAMLGWSEYGSSSRITTFTPAATLTATCTSLKFPGTGTDSPGNTATVTVSGVSADDINMTTTLHDPDADAS